MTAPSAFFSTLFVTILNNMNARDFPTFPPVAPRKRSESSVGGIQNDQLRTLGNHVLIMSHAGTLLWIAVETTSGQSRCGCQSHRLISNTLSTIGPGSAIPRMRPYGAQVCKPGTAGTSSPPPPGSPFDRHNPPPDLFRLCQC